jgi:hypothetical protein
MNTFRISALALGIFAIGQLSAGCPSGKCGASRDPQVQGRYGTYNEYTSRRMTQVGQLTEPMLLNQLDKQARRQFYSLDEQGRQLALQLANSGQFRDKNDAIAAAVEQSSNKNVQQSTERLQNGMK